jgi:hypothetical protein
VPETIGGDDEIVLHSNIQQLFTSILDRYQQCHLPAKQKKVVQPTLAAVVVLGVQFQYHTVSIANDKMRALMIRSLSLLTNGSCTGVVLSSVIGSWTWCLLLRRPALSVLRSVYRFIAVADEKVYVLWPSVRKELIQLCCMAPMLYANLAAHVHETVLATDASTEGAGVVASNLTPTMLRRIWPLWYGNAVLRQAEAQRWCIPHLNLDAQLCNRRSSKRKCAKRFAAPLMVVQPAVHLYSKRPMRNPRSFTCEIYGARERGARWRHILSHRWRYQEHITVLEARALLLSLRWLCSLRSTWSRTSTDDVTGADSANGATGANGAGHVRIVSLIDNSVVYYSICKGRTRSPELTPVLRSIHALLLASHMAVLPAWIPSHWNPADAASRNFDRHRDRGDTADSVTCTA